MKTGFMVDVHDGQQKYLMKDSCVTKTTAKCSDFEIFNFCRAVLQNYIKSICTK